MPKETDVITEITDMFVVKKKESTKETETSKAKIYVPTESEVALSNSLSKDYNEDTEEIVPCCTYFWWGSYLACCTEDLASLKLLGVYASKRKNPMDFENSRLYITRIKATGVQSAEFIGKNDLYLDLFLGKWSDRTKVLEDCGPDGEWNYGDQKIIDASSKTIAKQNFKVLAYDKNKVLTDIFIGEGSVTLNSLLEVGFDKEKSFTFPISDKANKLVGQIMVSLILRKKV